MKTCICFFSKDSEKSLLNHIFDYRIDAVEGEEFSMETHFYALGSQKDEFDKLGLTSKSYIVEKVWDEKNVDEWIRYIYLRVSKI